MALLLLKKLRRVDPSTRAEAVTIKMTGPRWISASKCDKQASGIRIQDRKEFFLSEKSGIPSPESAFGATEGEKPNQTFGM